MSKITVPVFTSSMRFEIADIEPGAVGSWHWADTQDEDNYRSMSCYYTVLSDGSAQIEQIDRPFGRDEADPIREVETIPAGEWYLDQGHPCGSRNGYRVQRGTPPAQDAAA